MASSSLPFRSTSGAPSLWWRKTRRARRKRRYAPIRVSPPACQRCSRGWASTSNGGAHKASQRIVYAPDVQYREPTGSISGYSMASASQHTPGILGDAREQRPGSQGNRRGRGGDFVIRGRTSSRRAAKPDVLKLLVVPACRATPRDDVVRVHRVQAAATASRGIARHRRASSSSPTRSRPCPLS
jgi:hypothetical protein